MSGSLTSNDEIPPRRGTAIRHGVRSLDFDRTRSAGNWFGRYGFSERQNGRRKALGFRRRGASRGRDFPNGRRMERTCQGSVRLVGDSDGATFEGRIGTEKSASVYKPP